MWQCFELTPNNTTTCAGLPSTRRRLASVSWRPWTGTRWRGGPASRPGTGWTTWRSTASPTPPSSASTTRSAARSSRPSTRCTRYVADLGNIFRVHKNMFSSIRPSLARRTVGTCARTPPSAATVTTTTTLVTTSAGCRTTPPSPSPRWRTPSSSSRRPPPTSSPPATTSPSTATAET